MLKFHFNLLLFIEIQFNSMAIVLTLLTNKNKYTEKQEYKNTVNTITHITQTPRQLSKHTHITKPTHTHTHTHTLPQFLNVV